MKTGDGNFLGKSRTAVADTHAQSVQSGHGTGISCADTVTHIHDIVYSAAGLISRRISIVIIGQRDRERIISDGVPESGGVGNTIWNGAQWHIFNPRQIDVIYILPACATEQLGIVVIVYADPYVGWHHGTV